MKTAKDLLNIFTTYINFNTKIDTNFFERLEQEKPEIKTKAHACIACSGNSGALSSADMHKKSASTKSKTPQQKMDETQRI